MKALIIAPQPFFTPRGTPFSVYYRTLVTAELGVKVDLLTYGEGQDVDIPGVRILRIPRFGFLGPIKVGPSYPKLILDVFMFIWTVRLLLINRYDFVHAHEEAVFFCRFLKPFFRFKLIYDMHSSLPQQLANFQFTKSKIITWLFKEMENSCLHAADAVITICPDLADYVNNLIPAKKDKHILIENSIFERVKLIDRNLRSKRDSLKTNDHLRLNKMQESGGLYVVYAGTLEPYQGIDILIRAFKKVISEDADAHLIIVGGNSAQIEQYSSLAASIGIHNNVLFTGRVPQHLARQYTGFANVLVSPRVSGTNTPLKIYEQIASGIPLVATRIYSHTQVLSDDVAILVEPEPSDFARGILKAMSSDGFGGRIAANARQLYERKYSRRIYEKKMKKLFARLFSKETDFNFQHSN
jgi:glycosyltransferase involved in cell wall biosynthesis